MNKIRKTIFIAIFVSLASQVKFAFLTDGFIIAMSVLVMAIFIYCYEDLSPMYVAFCSGIFSPLIRLMIQVVEGGTLARTAFLVIPDMVFFFSYGVLYTLIYQHILKQPKNIRNFPCVIFFCDFFSNMAELTTRSVLLGSNIIDTEDACWLLFIAVCRTILTQTILIAMETYSTLLVREEHDKEYRKLLVQASIFESELHVMEKNATEIEEIMRQAFHLHKEMKELPLPKGLKNQALDISKNAHEIKGDYLNIISVLKDVFFNDLDEGKLPMSDLIHIEKANVQSTIKERGYHVDISTKVKTDFYVRNYFKMMSIIGNLLLNAAEAIGDKKNGGKIQLVLRQDQEYYILMVRDNGPGISKAGLETVFIEGFSTKFNGETGNVQRGLGLTLVKDYVENLFDGTIRVDSQEGVYTEFTVKVPVSSFEEVES